MGDAENKGRNTMIGAAAGAGLGAWGGSKLAPKIQTFGRASAPALRNLGTDILSGQVGKGNMLDTIASRLSPQMVTGKPAEKVTAKIGPPFLKKDKAAMGEMTGKQYGPKIGQDPWHMDSNDSHLAVPNIPSKIMHGLGDVAENLSVMQHGIKGGAEGKKGLGKLWGGLRGGGSSFGSVIRGNVTESQRVMKDVGGKNFQFERSRFGKAVNPLLMSGVGMGATGLLMSGKDDEGKKQSMGKRLVGAGETTLAWGGAPQLMMGKMMDYDLPKMGLDVLKKPKADKKQTIQPK
jgi:hypothetical protein